jgi:hypothetical protein
VTKFLVLVIFQIKESPRLRGLLDILLGLFGYWYIQNTILDIPAAPTAIYDVYVAEYILAFAVQDDTNIHTSCTFTFNDLEALTSYIFTFNTFLCRGYFLDASVAIRLAIEELRAGYFGLAASAENGHVESPEEVGRGGFLCFPFMCSV